MNDPIKAFFNGIIDYAGLFPPARLELEPAFRSYLKHRRCPESWMLGRFIIPASRLADLRELHQSMPAANEPPVRLSVIAGTGDTRETAFDLWRRDAVSIRRFLSSVGGCFTLESLETRFPDDMTGPADSSLASTFLVRVVALIESLAALKPGPELYVEIPPTGEWRSNDRIMLDALNGAHRVIDDAGAPPVTRLGAKLRCGGLEPAAFPVPERVALFIRNCLDLGLPLKCTAGLHHPVRHTERETGLKQHGFLNVFGAGILAHALSTIPENLEQCISDENDDHFGFDNKGFHWVGNNASTPAIEKARHMLMTGFGSCSFDEPRDDLRTLGILE